MAEPPNKPNLTPAPEDLATRLEGSTIEEVLRIQDHLAKFVRERYEKQVAVLFSDIAGSTAYFEKHGDTAGRRMIQRHNDLLMPLIEARGGKIVKTIGDAIMATFLSAHLAVDAAIAMQQGVYDANNRTTSDAERFEIRIGVNYGTALVNDKDGDVYGDMVNVAARVQSQAEKRQIYISEGVREYISPTIPLRPAGRFTLKGKSQEFSLYEVVWKELVKQDVPVDRPKIDPRYVVLDMLGSGGMASVWRARDERLGRDVAVKSLHRHVQLSVSARERFQREARVAASLTHENITQVYDYSAQGASEAFIAMELVEGETLRAYSEKTGPLPCAAVALIGHEIARGLAYAHQKGVIHRDVKPENILISKTGAVKISDFGIAGVGELARLTATGAAIGTPAYLSPEQVKGGTADNRSDQFSLGVILYEIATGRSPFAGESSSAVMYRIVEGNFTPPEAVARVDGDVAQVIKKCLAREPRDRFASADALADRLRELLASRGLVDPRSALTRFFAGVPLPESDPGVTGEIRRLSSRGRALLFAVAGLGVVGLAALGLSFALRPASQPRESLAPADPFPVVHIAAPPNPVNAVPVAETVPVPEPDPDPVHRTPETPKSKLPRPKHPKQPVVPVASRLSSKEDDDPPPKPEAPDKDPPARPSEFGSLKLVVSGGWADIKIDGASMGRAPVVRLLTVAAGVHVLELGGNSLRRPYRAQIHIEPGKTLEHRAELQALP
ncbi:MAG: protein kinase domain-containing protein [Myxococcaceae bacterium]